MKVLLDTNRELAFTDLECTGTSPHKHEILEIGLVLVDQNTLEVIEEWEAKVIPEHPENADPESLKVNGWKQENWADAISLEEAVTTYAKKVEGAIFTAHNVAFDWGFMSAAFDKLGIPNPTYYHRLCTYSICWHEFRDSGMERISLETISERLGIPVEPKPHRALTGAKQALAVYKAIRARNNA